MPMPHELVSLWRESVDTFGTADDGRPFFDKRGGIVGSGIYDRAGNNVDPHGPVCEV